jgi:hypothetical protein
MDACCETKAEELRGLRDEHKKVLVIVLIINAVVFVVEVAIKVDGPLCAVCGVVARP